MMKLCVTDFWPDVDPESNFFTDSIRQCKSGVKITSIKEADVIVYSCFGKEHKAVSNKDTIKIFYTGEDLRPNYEDCTYSLTFD